MLGVFAILFTFFLLRGIHAENITAASLAAIVLGIFNITLKPILFILTLPLTFISLGFFTLLINASLVSLTSLVVPGFQIDNFLWAILFSLTLIPVNYALNKIVE